MNWVVNDACVIANGANKISYRISQKGETSEMNMQNNTANPLYQYQVVQLDISAKPHHLYESMNLEYSPLYRSLKIAKDALLSYLQLNGLGDKLKGKLEAVTDAVISKSNDDTAMLFATLRGVKGKKLDYVITIRRVWPDREITNTHYSFNLCRMMIAATPAKEGLMFENPLFYHGPLCSSFDKLKAEMIVYLSGHNPFHQDFAKLKESISRLSLDVLNIGKWERDFTEQTDKPETGLLEWRLKVFRASIEG